MAKRKKGSKPKPAAKKKSSGISRRAVLKALVTGGLVAPPWLAQVTGLTLKDAVHFLMRMGTLDWTVHPIRRGERTMFFSDGTYLLLARAGAEQPALYIHAGDWQLLGIYGQVALPEGFPNVTIEQGVRQVAVVPSSSKPPQVGSTVWEPNLRIVQVTPPTPPSPPTGLKIIV